MVYTWVSGCVAYMWGPVWVMLALQPLVMSGYGCPRFLSFCGLGRCWTDLEGLPPASWVSGFDLSVAEEGENLTLKNLASGNYAYTRKDSKHGLNKNCISYDPSFANCRTINHHSST